MSKVSPFFLKRWRTLLICVLIEIFWVAAWRDCATDLTAVGIFLGGPLIVFFLLLRLFRICTSSHLGWFFFCTISFIITPFILEFLGVNLNY